MTLPALLLVGGVLAAVSTNPFGLKDPLIGRPAPELDAAEWINSPPLTLASLRGRVVVVEFFQMHCPGCRKFSRPLMREWDEAFRNDPRIVLLSVHTVFEGHEGQGPKRLKAYLKRHGAARPVAVDRHEGADHVPVTMRRWATRGTPCLAVVDAAGVVRFKVLGGFQSEPVARLIRALAAEAGG